jgi:NDP-sugar pyrophosphorylase family protein
MLAEHTPTSLATVDVLILCGGLGSRLRPIVHDRPKGLALVGGKPFMDILVEDLIRQGFRRVIFCVGYLKEQIIDRYSARGDAEYRFSQEDVPLGTGGAVQNALPLIRSNPFVVMNGDSRCHVDFKELYAFHHIKAAAASFVVTQADQRHDGGVVCLDETQKIRFFLEKSRGKDQHGCFISAGIYLLQQEDVGLPHMALPCSLEQDVFPTLVNTKSCYGFVVGSQLVDIGTPERYWKANEDCHQ